MKIYIDSNIFVDNVIETEQHHKESKEFIDFILNNNPSKDVAFFTSRFTEVEVASAVYRRTNNEDKAQATLYKLEKPWKNKILLFPPDPKKKLRIDDFVIKLVETALRYGTTFGDTVHANDVESYDIDYLVTWNTTDFQKMKNKIPKLKIVSPKEMLDILKW